jgi:hypothetical protein
MHSDPVLQALDIFNKITGLLIKAFRRSELTSRGLKELLDRAIPFIKECMDLIKKYATYDPKFGPVSDKFTIEFDEIPDGTLLEKNKKYQLKFYPLEATKIDFLDVTKFVKLNGSILIGDILDEIKITLSKHIKHFPYEYKILCLSGRNILSNGENTVHCIFHSSQADTTNELQIFEEKFNSDDNKYYVMCVIPVEANLTGEEIF